MSTYCYINIPLLIKRGAIDHRIKPRQHRFLSDFEFLPSDRFNAVTLHACTAEPPQIDKVINAWGTFAHDGRMSQSLNLYATIIERFWWVELEGV